MGESARVDGGGIDHLHQYMISQSVSYLSDECVSSKPILLSLVCVCFHVVMFSAQ